MIVDTSALLAFFDELEDRHDEVVDVISGAETCVVSPYVIAELDYLIASRYGRESELAALNELLQGDWELATLSSEDLACVSSVLAGYDQVIGVTDASNLVLAQRYMCTDIATLDRRHFSYLHMPGAKPLTVYP